MNKQKLYAVKDDKGYYWEFKDLCGIDLGGFWELLDVSVPFTVSEEDAKNTAKANGGHVVELVDAPAKIVVSEEEAKMLKKAKDTTVWRPAAVISDYAYNAAKDSNKEVLLEDRLMRAYVNGWTVEKHKQFVLPMEGTKLADGTIAYATLDPGVWMIKAYSEKQSAVAFHGTVTQADIDAAPDWVKAIKAVEVTDDEQ